jgi:hypothetical protein
MKLLVPQSVVFKTYQQNDEGQKGAGVLNTYSGQADDHGGASYGTGRDLNPDQYRP